MKKNMILMMALVAIIATSLTSCFEQQVKKGERLTSMLKVEASKDLIDACDIEIIYKGKGGINTRDTISATEWYKIVVNDSFPTKIGLVTFRYLIKPGFKPTKDTYDLQLNWYMMCKEQSFETRWYPLMLLDVPGDKVESFLDLYNMVAERTIKEENNPNIINSGITTVTKVLPASNTSPFIFENYF